MPETPLSQAVQTIIDVVDLYDDSAPRLDHRHALFTLVDTIRLADSRGIRLGALDEIAEGVHAIQSELRSSLDATIGMLIGRLAPEILQEIDAEIETHRTVLEGGGDDAAAAQWHIGRLEHRKNTIQALFQRFVNGAGSL